MLPGILEDPKEIAHIVNKFDSRGKPGTVLAGNLRSMLMKCQN